MVAGKVSESRLTINTKPAFHFRLEDVRILQIEPTTYCNARCPHCPRFDSTGQFHPDLTLGHLNINIINNIELSKMSNLKKVFLEGDKGDPLMHPEIEQIIETFSQAPSRPYIRVITNGSIRTPSWWKALAEKKYPNLSVIFSIDGLEDTNHLYRVGLDYDTIINNAKAFISAGGRAIWKFIVFKHNQHQFEQVLELSKQMGFAEFSYTPCRSGDFQGLTQWPVLHKGHITHYLEQPTRVFEMGSIKHNIDGATTMVYDSYPERLCPFLEVGKIYINYLGQVVPCCMMHFDTILNYPGTDQLRMMTGGFDNQDLNKHTMGEILNNKFFSHSLYDSLLNGPLHFNCERSCKSKITQNLKYVQSQI